MAVPMVRRRTAVRLPTTFLLSFLLGELLLSSVVTMAGSVGGGVEIGGVDGVAKGESLAGGAEGLSM